MRGCQPTRAVQSLSSVLGRQWRHCQALIPASALSLWGRNRVSGEEPTGKSADEQHRAAQAGLAALCWDPDSVSKTVEHQACRSQIGERKSEVFSWWGQWYEFIHSFLIYHFSGNQRRSSCSQAQPCAETLAVPSKRQWAALCWRWPLRQWRPFLLFWGERPRQLNFPPLHIPEGWVKAKETCRGYLSGKFSWILFFPILYLLYSLWKCHSDVGHSWLLI